MQKIILTEKRSDAEVLKKLLTQSGGELENIDNFEKGDVVSSPNIFCDVIVIFSTWNMPVFNTNEVKAYFPSLKYVFYAAGSVEYFSEPFKACGVEIYSAIKENSRPVAEFIVGQTLLANKGFFLSQRKYKSPFWPFAYKIAKRYSTACIGNYGANIGIIGCGEVGRQVLGHLTHFDLNIWVCDPKLSDNEANVLGVKKCLLPEIFEYCDVISNNLPNLPETKNLLNKKLFSKMKKSVVFINTGRGAQVVELDLVKAMWKRPKACALLDVLKNEPLKPWSPLLWTPNIFLTPHIAGSQCNEFDRLVHAMIPIYKSIELR